MSAQVVSRPSDARRHALSASTEMGEKGVPLVSNFFPLERYYDAADRVLLAFNEAFATRRLDDAYVYGKRFAIFSLNALPTHNYYNSPKYGRAKVKNKEDMTEVITKLEMVATWMDAEELEKERERKRLEAERKRQQEEIARKEGEAALLRLNEFKREVQRKQREHSSQNFEQSALDKLKKLEMMNGNQNDDVYLDDLKNAFPRRGGKERTPHSSMSDLHGSSLNDMDNGSKSGIMEYGQRSEGRLSRHNSNESGKSPIIAPRRSSNEREESRRRKSNDGQRSPYGSIRRFSNERQPLPPPLAPPTLDGLPPPPSYHAVLDSKFRDNNRTNQNPPSVLEQAAARAAANGSSAALSSSQSASAVYRPFTNRDLEKTRRATRTVKTPFSETKQEARKKYEDLKAGKRIHVMPINTHQGRLGHSTNGCAVISPLVVSHHLRSRSAVTDHEIVDVIDKECGPLLKEIRGKLGLDGHALIIPSDVHDHLVDKKVLDQDAFVGATGGNILDRKHLSEFLRLVDSGEKNSHQNKRTGAALFFREHVVSIVKVPLNGGKWCYDLIDSLPGLSNGSTHMATRTRCRDLSAFESFIRYYACSKLSESNCNYIDKNDWDDSMADFDPRVFQGFVWGDKA